ncbi:hypothetical protein GGI11_002478 [Coemansia sp. RSA 2049]|nr:hypothetical protein GGI11_002478 [Coemansia sp. RSA 2049]
MRFSTLATVFGLVSCAVAAPYYGGNVGQVITVPPIVAPPVGGTYPGSGATYPGSGNGGSGNNGNGSSGNGSNGNGSNGNNGAGNNGNGSNGNGSNGSGPVGGPVGNPADCGLSPGQVAALTPLVNELQLTRTVDDLKHLTKQITDLLANTLQEPATSSILNIVDSVVGQLGLGGLDLKPTVDSVTSILRKQVPCVLDTLLPKP